MHRFGLLLLLAGCTGGERVANAPKAGDTLQLPAIEWRVADQRALQAVYQNSGMAAPDGHRLQGFAGMRDGKAVIYTLPPRYVDDEVACTLGHEVMHIALGKYHKETK